MRKIIGTMMVAPLALLASCNTVEGVGEDIQSAAGAFDPSRTYAACGSYQLDANGDGRVSNTEYNTYRSGAYGAWDTNRDGRISRAEYADCWYGGGFYPTYQRQAYEPSWTAFDANSDGYLSSDEYWSMAQWTRLDRNNDGVVDNTEWPY
jgi:predicted small secreted protein